MELDSHRECPVASSRRASLPGGRACGGLALGHGQGVATAPSSAAASPAPSCERRGATGYFAWKVGVCAGAERAASGSTGIGCGTARRPATPRRAPSSAR